MLRINRHGGRRARATAAIAAALAACLPLGAQAQRRPAPPSPAAIQKAMTVNIGRAMNAQEQMLTQKLSLSHPQQTRLHRIEQKYLPKIVSLQTDAFKMYSKAQQRGGGNPQAAMKGLQARQIAITNGLKSEVEAILTPTQRKKLASLEEAQRQQMMERLRQMQQQRGMMGAPGQMRH